MHAQAPAPAGPRFGAPECVAMSTPNKSDGPTRYEHLSQRCVPSPDGDYILYADYEILDKLCNQYRELATEQATKLAALEAENARLREALKADLHDLQEIKNRVEGCFEASAPEESYVINLLDGRILALRAALGPKGG